MASSSSTKKAAKLAQKGKGRKVRFQGGTVFPAAVALTLVIGLGLIVYSRSTLPAAAASPPTINDHWHAAYGLYLCDDWFMLNGNLEELSAQGGFVNTDFRRTGIHSHDDGVIHWHPYTSAAVGDNAVLGVFLENYGVELTNESIRFENVGAVGPNPNFPPANGFDVVDEYVEGETQCNGEDAEVSIKAWGSFTDTDGGNRYIANMDRIHLDNDGMVFGIYFTPKDTPQNMPPWASQLPELGAVDMQQIRPEDLIQSDTGTGTDTGADTVTDAPAETGTDESAPPTTAAG